ncbi:TonB family protein [Autumnicola musiva]|uniref:TonB family protein n=1 Tax=Autumnicola musiva TaxID=3075589 RepID=A0ABU3DA54_9FLAO|nr:TonB family protein [Zunongwangia sp. F117]MDT0678420.1 TonB family protein [Zunongwangia sp. F117]
MEEFFDKHKALIITVLLFLVLLLALYNFNFSSRNVATSEMLVNLEQVKELQNEEQEEPEETPAQQQQQVQTHRAYNKNQEARQQNFDRQLNEIFERNSAAREQTSEETESNSSTGDYNLSKRKKEQSQKRSDGNNRSEATSAKSGTMENSSISFSLKGRNAVEIPNPIYTCDTSGRIVVNITVNADGRVTNTGLNKASSTSTNECLIEQALQYAAGARFTPLSGRNSQPGSISYQFKP